MSSNMSPEFLKQAISYYAKKIGISLVGFTSAEPFGEMQSVLVDRRDRGYQSDFEDYDLAERINPDLHLPGAKSFIAVGLAYPSRLPKGSKGASASDDTDGLEAGCSEARGQVSRSAWGRDYHEVLGEKLAGLVDYIESLVPDSENRYFVDRGSLLERSIAERAGLGWIGKNSLLLNPVYGSYVFLGEILTTLDLPADEPVGDGCGECRICIDACPNQAINEDRGIQAQLCLSQLTQKKNLPADAYSLLGGRIYGCDTCQEVCPINLDLAQDTGQEQVAADFLPLVEQARPALRGLMQLTKQEFQKNWAPTAAGWRGRNLLRRNAVIAAGNLGERAGIDREILVKELEILVQAESEEISRAAAWAVEELNKN